MYALDIVQAEAGLHNVDGLPREGQAGAQQTGEIVDEDVKHVLHNLLATGQMLVEDFLLLWRGRSRRRASSCRDGGATHRLPQMK